jgi:hypothetical protein
VFDDIISQAPSDFDGKMLNQSMQQKQIKLSNISTSMNNLIA